MNIKNKKLKHYSGAAMPPIFQQSTIIFDCLEDLEKAEFNYARQGTATNRALESKINSLENANFSLITQSGASAVYLSLLALAENGDHILVCDTAYSPTKNFCEQVLKKANIEFDCYPGDIGEDIKNWIKPNTKVIFLESPSSIFYQIQDIEAIVKIAQSKNITTVLDNSYASSVLFKPLDYGIDVCVLSASKYYSGHADIVMGVVATQNESVFKKLNSIFKNFGYHTSPFDCYLTYRGLETLQARIKSQAKTAKKVAQFLEKQKEIEMVLYPELKSFSQRDRFKQYFKQANGLISFSFKQQYSKQQIRKFVDALQCFGIGFSWGGCESIVMIYDKHTTRPKNLDNIEYFVRLSIGQEPKNRLIEDIKNALLSLS